MPQIMVRPRLQDQPEEPDFKVKAPRGFFGRVVAALRRNPRKTLSAVAAVASGAVYSLPAREIVAEFFRIVFGE